MKNKALVWTVVLSLVVIGGYVAYVLVNKKTEVKKKGLLSVSGSDLEKAGSFLKGLFTKKPAATEDNLYADVG